MIDNEFGERRLSMNGVQPDQVYRHYKGTRYRVLAVAHDEADRGRLIVVYREECDGDAPVWARPLAQWLDYVDGGPRYQLVTIKGGPADGDATEQGSGRRLAGRRDGSAGQAHLAGEAGGVR